MTDLPTAMAGLVAALMSDAPSNAILREALNEVSDALEHLGTDPAASEGLREQIDRAKAAGQLHINSMPVYLLQVFLPADDQGGDRHE